MKLPWGKIVTGLTIVSLLLGIMGGFWKYDQTKANAADVEVVKEEIKLMQQKYELEIQLMKKEFDTRDNIIRERDLENRIWTLKNRYEGKPTYEIPLSVKEEIHRLEMELNSLRRN